MNKKLIITEIVGFFVTVVLSFIFHFMYEWTGALAFLFPVNESVWEHVKILFIPYLLYTIIELIVLEPTDKLNFLAIKAVSLIIIPIVMIVLFYTYSGIIGRHFTVIDILIGIFSLLIGFYISLKLLMINYKFNRPLIPITIASLILIFLIVFTYYPPRIELFRDTIEDKYGK